MSLPSGYKRLEYIQSNGNQWIDSGIVPGSSDFSVKSKIRTTAATSAENWFVTIGHSKQSGMATFAQFGTWSSKFVIHLTGVVVDGSTAATSKDVTIDFSMSGNTASLSGDASYRVTNAYYGSGSFRNQSITICDGLWRTYWSQIKVSGSIVRDYIPCQKPDGTIGLWDDVNSVFYGNAGTGTFTAGPVIAIAADESDIKELEYIQSTGTQYVDTLFAPSVNTRLVMNFEPTKAYSSIAGIFGVRDTNASNAPLMFVFWNNGALSFRSDYFGTQKSLAVSTLLEKHTVDKNKNVVTIDTVSATHTVATGQCTNTIYLFCANSAGTANYFSRYKLYSCQIYDNGILVRDYIAAKLSDGTVGLYDKLNGLLYINMGTGTFTAGPVVASPSIFVNINGIWKPINHIYVNINNIWQKST